MGLYQKHRPSELSQVIGNNGILNTLQPMLGSLKSCPHAFLLHGPTGCGKTTIARIIGASLGSKGMDLKEIDSADFRGIDTVREIRKQCQYAPMESPCQVWIIDECHRLTGDAASALLKILEDTPNHVYFVLCTTDPQKLLPTIKGRCSQFQVNPLSDREMLRLLRRVCREEGKSIEKEVYEQIIQDSFGHPRNALVILDQVLCSPPEKQLETARQTAAQTSQAIELCRALISRNGWKTVATILAGMKDQDPEAIRRIVLGYCQAVLLKGENDLAAQIMECFIEPFYNTLFPGLVFACYSVVKG
jgi:DNA polymerase III subunit gamma/tau